LVVTVDKDQCLLIYPLPDWEEIERKTETDCRLCTLK